MMNRAQKKRARRRTEAVAKLTRYEALQIQLHLIGQWSKEFRRRYRNSPAEGLEFQLHKECELRALEADEETIRRFRSACNAERFSIEDDRRVLDGAPGVPGRLVSDYEAVELYELREFRQR